ncbi:MAG: ATP-binding protein, partial [Dehalococcoidales bacterium]
ERVKISVTDNGTGIPKENLNKIFNPFFTTRGVGKGTGLGLSTCYGIVTAHGGLIHAENNDEGGATFTVTLPLYSSSKQ